MRDEIKEGELRALNAMLRLEALDRYASQFEGEEKKAEKLAKHKERIRLRLKEIVDGELTNRWST